MVNDNSSRFVCKKFCIAVTVVRFLALFSVVMALKAVARGGGLGASTTNGSRFYTLVFSFSYL